MESLRILAYLISTVFIVACNGPSKKVQSSPNWENGAFRNRLLPKVELGPFDYLVMKFFGDEEFPDSDAISDFEIPKVKANLGLIKSPGDSPQVTWIGHATCLVQYQGINILTDPIFSERASPVSFAGPKRYTAPALLLEQLPKINFVVISHNHFDHLDSKTVQFLGNKTTWFVPLGLKNWFLDEGVSAEKVVELDWGESSRLGDAEVTATPSQHWSKRGLFDRNQSFWASWFVKIGEFSFWFAGDTGYDPEIFKTVKNYGEVDLGIIPIGAYAPRWFMEYQHVDVSESIQIHQDIGAKKSLGIHWGTFVLTSEPVSEPPEKLKYELEKQNLAKDSFLTIPIGKTIMIEK